MARKSIAREADSKALCFLYKTVPGRAVLKLLCKKGISDICGKYMDSPASACMIKAFVKKNHIRMSDYTEEEYRCFNDFFTRRIKPEKRPVCMDKDALIAPCDGLLSAYRISGDTVIPVKQGSYTIGSLLQDADLAGEYRDGICLVFRLCVDHYHRYCYVDSGNKSDNTYIEGILHTVRPVALENEPVFT